MPLRANSGGAGDIGGGGMTTRRGNPKANALASPLPPTRQPIYCRCCGTAILAERVEDAIVIKTRRKGKFHVAVVQCPRAS